jgi:L-iditol 2-dehydrogenase
MKAMMLTGIRQMEMMDVPDIAIKSDTDVLIKMKAVGVCGSDVHYYNTGRIGSQVVEFPYAVGHECAGVVEAAGKDVTDLKPGDRIAIDPAISCHKCDQCLSGRHHTCRELLFLGCPGQLPGCLSEYIVMPRECCYKISDSMSFEQAAISEPLAIGVYAVKKSIPMKGADIGILGSGPIGLSVLLPAKMQGAAKVYVTDKIDSRLDVAKKCGADWCGNPDKQDVVADITAKEPLLLDVVFECCGQQEAIDQAIELLKPGGKLVMIGIPEVDRISFSIDQIRRKEICIQNIRRQIGCVQDALDMIDNGLNVDIMATHKFKFDQTKQAFYLVAAYKDGVVKAMIEF